MGSWGGVDLQQGSGWQMDVQHLCADKLRGTTGE